MSSSPGAEAGRATVEARALPLAVRLAIAYAALIITILAAAGLLLDRSLGAGLDRDLDTLIEHQLRAMGVILSEEGDHLREIREEIRFDSGKHTLPRVYIRVYDDGGAIVAETQGMASEFPPSSDWRSEVSGVASSATRGDCEWRRQTVSHPGTGPYHVEVAIERAEMERVLARFRRQLLLLLLGSAAVAVIASYFLARRGLRPLDRVTEAAARVGARTLGERLAVDGAPAEIARLAETFNSMLARLEDAFRRLENFGADLAHELRTPVHNLRGEAEVALMKQREPEEYRDVLVGMIEECERLARMCDDLLLLSRVESHHEALEAVEFDLGEELEKIGAYYEATAQARAISVAVAPTAGLCVRADRGKVRRALANLIENAITYGRDGGRVTVIAWDRGSKGIEVIISDDGPGIAPEHLARVFERFYRIEKSRSRAHGGSGLGLGICRTLIEAHGGTVTLESEVGKGTRVIVRLPPSCRAGPPTPAPPLTAAADARDRTASPRVPLLGS